MFLAGELFEELPPSSRDINVITDLMERGCKNKYRKACIFLGNYYFSKITSKKGGEFLGKACKMKHFLSCYNAGRFYERRGSRRDMRKARSFYRKACKRKLRKACFALEQMR